MASENESSLKLWTTRVGVPPLDSQEPQLTRENASCCGFRAYLGCTPSNIRTAGGGPSGPQPAIATGRSVVRDPGLKAVLDGHTGADLVLLSEVRERVRPRSHCSATRIAEVLAELELLHDDTTAAIRTWIDRRAGELPAGFGRDVRAWLVVLLDGDARTRPRSHATVRVHFGIVRPFIQC